MTSANISSPPLDYFSRKGLANVYFSAIEVRAWKPPASAIKQESA
jgi:hypothetical protein